MSIQDFEASETAPPPQMQPSRESLPGIAPALLAILAAFTVTWIGLGAATDSRMSAAGNPESELATVAAGERDGAIGSLNQTPGLMKQIKGTDSACPLPLAWVSIIAAPGKEGGKIRLQSGSYFSPVYTAGAVPIRVAIPFPAPYETGHGVLRVSEEGGDAVVSLDPAWTISTKGGAVAHPVRWSVAEKCTK